MINCTEHKGKLEFIKRIPRTHTRGKGPVRFVLRIDGYRVTTKPFDPIVSKIPDLVGKECVAVIGVWHTINVLGSIKLAAEVTMIKTIEEYKAAAALLGLDYSLRTHAFYGVEMFSVWTATWVDADTGEELQWERRVKRRAVYSQLRDAHSHGSIIQHFRDKGL